MRIDWHLGFNKHCCCLRFVYFYTSVLDVTERPGFNRFEYYPNPSIEYNDAVLEYEEGQPLIIKVRVHKVMLLLIVI